MVITHTLRLTRFGRTLFTSRIICVRGLHIRLVMSTYSGINGYIYHIGQNRHYSTRLIYTIRGLGMVNSTLFVTLTNMGCMVGLTTFGRVRGEVVVARLICHFGVGTRT